MHPILHKTFGGLSKQYYFRQLFFGAFFAAIMLAVIFHTESKILLGTLLVIANTLLYPYARFVYESIVGFIVGENAFLVSALLMLWVKVMTMAICWGLALFIAPVGLAYLYYHHSKAEA